MADESRSGETHVLVVLVEAALLAVVGGAAGMVFGFLLLLLGALRRAIPLLLGVEVNFEDLRFVPLYVAALSATGAAIGLLWPLRRWTRAYYGVSTALMGGASFLVARDGWGPVSTWKDGSWGALGLLTVCLGLGFGYAVRLFAADVESGF